MSSEAILFTRIFQIDISMRCNTAKTKLLKQPIYLLFSGDVKISLNVIQDVVATCVMLL